MAGYSLPLSVGPHPPIFQRVSHTALPASYFAQTMKHFEVILIFCPTVVIGSVPIKYPL